MPYIPEARRGPLRDNVTPETVGELNFKLTDLVDDFLGEPEDLTYDRLNAAVGVLECAKLELYRRVVVPYEKRKRAAHGDVYYSAGTDDFA